MILCGIIETRRQLHPSHTAASLFFIQKVTLLTQQTLNDYAYLNPTIIFSGHLRGSRWMSFGIGLGGCLKRDFLSRNKFSYSFKSILHKTFCLRNV